MKAPIKKPVDMTAREYARWLHLDCCLSFEEACRMAGYDPEADLRRQVLTFVMIMGGIGSLFVAVAYFPDALALVMP